MSSTTELAKQRLASLFASFLENPQIEGLKKPLIDAMEAYATIARIEKDLNEEGYKHE